MVLQAGSPLHFHVKHPPHPEVLPPRVNANPVGRLLILALLKPNHHHPLVLPRRLPPLLVDLVLMLILEIFEDLYDR